MSSSESNRPVFYDPGGVRGKRLRRTRRILSILVTAVLGVFVASILINPFLPSFSFRPVAAFPNAPDAKQVTPPKPVPPGKVKLTRLEKALNQELSKTKAPPAKRASQIKITPPAVAPTPATNQTTRPLAIGFYVNWDDSSYESLKRNLGQLDWVVPEWLRVKDGDDPLIRDLDPKALDLIRRTSPKTPIIPMLHNSNDGVWDTNVLVRAIADDASRTKLVDALARFVEQNAFGGICIDFETVPAASQPNLIAFINQLHTRFQPRGWIVAQNLPFDDTSWDFKIYGQIVDYVMLMAYDQHWAESDPGSIAGLKWFQDTLNSPRMKELPPAKTIINIGGYGYDWVKGAQTNEVTFQAAILSARDSLDHVGDIVFEQPGLNPHFSYVEEDGSHHTVWFQDAVTAYNQLRASKEFHPAGFALWRLGSEDPSLWSIFGSGRMDNPPSTITEIKSGYDVDFEGVGEILQVDPPQDGARQIKVNPSTGFIESERYTKVPSSYVIRRTGYHPGQVALTFDDGPDPAWTPRILDILKSENVPATFFIIGRNGQDNPDLLRRIVAEGHDIGNHTFTHPNLGEIPQPFTSTITNLELTTTQRLIESVTGRSTILFRPPYFGDAEPTTPDEVEPAVLAKKLGYVVVGMKVDTDDWKRPGVDEIVNKTIAGITNTDPELKGQIVLLHDAGGDRSQTVEALPKIIHELRARGFTFVPVSKLAGATRDQAMPPLPPGQNFFADNNAVFFYVWSWGGWLLHWIFLVGIVMGIGRLIFIGALAFAQWLRSRKRALTHAGEDYQPFVSIIVPAYNEEKVIANTLNSLLASTYKKFEIIVVDDGSSDQTSKMVREQFGGEPRIQLFTRENAGKAEALNFGLNRATGEVIVALDADTIFSPDTVGALAHRFYDPRVGAVAGNAKVGNRINLITRWQALEYITSQNMDRRAFASLNCITVVPGAVGAWRKDLLLAGGGFASDTLAEDQDLTLKIRKLGHKISYEENAIAWTEAPDTIRSLAKQRYRWSFGTLQCMWKHRDALLRPKYGSLGIVAMPNVWIYQILFPLLSPVMDLTLIWTFVAALLEKAESPEYATNNFKQVLFYYALFLAIDWLGAAFAFAMEKRERWSLLWWLFLQRFCYRQIMYYVVVKSVWKATHGAIVGWGKLERKATVEAQP